MPSVLAYPPVTQLLDAMLVAARLESPHGKYIISLNPNDASGLHRNSDEAMGKHRASPWEYDGVTFLELDQVPEDIVMLTATADPPEEHRTYFVGRISTARVERVALADLKDFDIESLS